MLHSQKWKSPRAKTSTSNNKVEVNEVSVANNQMSLPRILQFGISGWPCRELEMRLAQVWTQDLELKDLRYSPHQHTHTTPELQKRWVSWGKTLCLQQWEAIRKSAHLRHSFRNYSENHTSSLCTSDHEPALHGYGYWVYSIFMSRKT